MEFLEQYSNYIVLVITLVIWAGIFFYMYSIDKKLNKIEKEK
ncbi:MAG TPA: CcmD family protein [Ignavibacteria bacterium]|jgi:CcmD family protein|nr:CcmD family protein [Ignavibacteria bacterium]